MKYRIILLALILSFIPIYIHANIPSKIIKEGVETIIRKSAKETGKKTGVEVVEIIADKGVKVGTGIGIATGGYQVGKGIRVAIENTGMSVSERVSQTSPEKVTHSPDHLKDSWIYNVRYNPAITPASYLEKLSQTS